MGPTSVGGIASPRNTTQTHRHGFDAEKTWHSLYLPTDWDAKRKFPVIVEWTGNGGYVDDRGDRCTGRPEDARLGYGLTGSHGWLWLSLPYLNDAGTEVVRTWWGDAPAHRPESTIRYAQAAIKDACEKLGGDPSRIVLCGFSRGSLACNALGLFDDDTAKLWRGMVCFSHYDGVKGWPYSGSDKESAKTRLARLSDRPQWILAEQPGATSPLLDATRNYLDGTGIAGRFTFSPPDTSITAMRGRSAPARCATPSGRSWTSSSAGDSPTVAFRSVETPPRGPARKQRCSTAGLPSSAVRLAPMGPTRFVRTGSLPPLTGFHRPHPRCRTCAEFGRRMHCWASQQWHTTPHAVNSTRRSWRFSAASTNPENSGCAAGGFDLNSG